MTLLILVSSGWRGEPESVGDDGAGGAQHRGDQRRQIEMALAGGAHDAGEHLLGVGAVAGAVATADCEHDRAAARPVLTPPQMHPDSSLRATEPPPLPGERSADAPVADYLVPRTGEKIRFQRVTETGEVQTWKRACDITLIDPACGTMHFGQYAFGLFHRMYLDEIEHAGQAGWPAEPSVGRPAAIPAAILENNLFGVDIDPRAIQIASLSLLLTAKEAALRQGFPPHDVQVKRTNLVLRHVKLLG